MTATDRNFPRRIPALIVFLHPFRLVQKEEEPSWESNIDEINWKSWNYELLHKLIGGVDVGLEEPYHLAIGFDGALVLPPIPELRNVQKAVQFYNRCLAALLLGGIYCEAVDTDSISLGSIIDWKYIRISKPGPSAASSFHHEIRSLTASPLDAISLLNPRTVRYYDIYVAMSKGMEIIGKIPNLSPEFLLKGTSGIARLDWGTGLSNLWIVVEQLISHLWEKHVIDSLPKGENRIVGQKEQLSDNRSWSLANKIELLFQKGVISEKVISSLFIARKVRNNLVHSGKHPDEQVSHSTYATILELIKIIIGNDFPLMNLDIRDHSISDPFQKPPTGKITPQFWRRIPKLPGEEELEREEIEKFRGSSEEENEI